MKSNQRAIYGMMMLIFAFFILIMMFAYFTINALSEGGGDSMAKGKEAIGVIHVKGIIYDSKEIIDLIKRAEDNEDIKAIIMRIDSPGGAVGPTQEVYQEILRVDSTYEQTQGKEGKPVYASFGAVAASGGYYLGAATRRIYSNPGAITGSIGVVMQFLDLHKLLEFLKIRPHVVKSGPYKDLGGPNRPMTDREKALVEGMVKDVHEQFIEDILRLRKKKIKGDLRALAQGQIFSGRQAFSHGLVDVLGGLEYAGRQIHKELKLKGKYSLTTIEKKKKGLWFSLVDELEGLLKTSGGLLKHVWNPGPLLSL